MLPLPTSSRCSQIAQSKVINSVFDAAGVKHLRYLDTASHKAHGDDNKNTDTYNDGGIYWVDSELAQSATKLDAKEKHSKKGKERES